MQNEDILIFETVNNNPEWFLKYHVRAEIFPNVIAFFYEKKFNDGDSVNTILQLSLYPRNKTITIDTTVH